MHHATQVLVDADGTPVTIAGWVSKATASSGRAAGEGGMG